MIIPARAAVRPRVVLPETGDTIPLDDLLSDFRGRPGEGLAFVGGIGAGKSAALAHAAACIGDGREVCFLDEPTIAEAWTAVVKGEAVIGVRGLWPDFPCRSYALAPWANDDLVEYLLARHPQQCASVMQRLAAAPDRQLHHGTPELCCGVLDRMAEDDGLVTVAAALRRDIGESLATPENLRVAQQFAIATLARDDVGASKSFKQLREGRANNRALRLLRHDPVQLLLAADSLAAALESPKRCPWLKCWLPRRLVELTGPLLSSTAIGHLRREVRRRNKLRHPMAASLMHATGRGWIPDLNVACNLTGAYLTGAYWAALRLKGVVLDKCDLSDSNLMGSALEHLNASQTNFSHAVLRDAWLIKLRAPEADFQGADLSSIKAECAELEGADLTDANVSGACLHGAVLRRAVLNKACFDGANLSKGNLRGAKIEDASFVDVNFEQADLTELPLREANITGAKFRHARMSMCDLEDAEAPATDFAFADLFGANFTSSRMPGANFSHAILKGAKLGDVNWEGADLTHANLSQCTFHFGSSRSGLVGSTIASEGSRTGFYTDEYDQQMFRPPEEIRKANLCGVDLTGANLKDTDFYLVDLRRAKYTPDQFEHLRRCRAILFDRDDPVV